MPNDTQLPYAKAEQLSCGACGCSLHRLAKLDGVLHTICVKCNSYSRIEVQARLGIDWAEDLGSAEGCLCRMDWPEPGKEGVSYDK